ncbi:MAG: hypothetical protein AB8B77_03155 [Alphaproteobacteria bacterium]
MMKWNEHNAAQQAEIEQNAALSCSMRSVLDAENINPIPSIATLWQWAMGIVSLSSAEHQILLQHPNLNKQFRSFREQKIRLNFPRVAAADSFKASDFDRLSNDDLPIRHAGGATIKLLKSRLDENRVVMIIHYQHFAGQDQSPLRLIEIIEDQVGAKTGFHQRDLIDNGAGQIDLHLHKELDKAFIEAYLSIHSRINLL